MGQAESRQIVISPADTRRADCCILVAMEGWQPFSDPRFALQFQYPVRAKGGEPVERVETHLEGMLRVHLLSPIGREVYFEVSRYDSLTAEAEYQRHRESLPKQFDSLAITDMTATTLASLPAYEYTFEWDNGKRTVLLIEHRPVTYRILYNPLFPVNLQILSTIHWLNLP